jgi:uncharacterized protein (DUF488 family)
MELRQVLTIGHSTRPLDELVRILQIHKITLLADVRTVPRSRHNPQFNGDTLPAALKSGGMGYEHLVALGGLRHSNSKDSLNSGWLNASFRSYADYMQTPDFVKAMDELIVTAVRERVALMCAEALPWRCHRALIADALLVRGFEVEHILGSTDPRKHVLTPWARVDGLQITYPPAASAGSITEPQAQSRG